ncbi:lactonase family protein [Anatilimnocola floriformis]|uniref:lactonase family protein n=1 Tax=Anatilimnocola floriformis TaxID=2948575 RepID=UPI0020C390BB|nr:lactonase family protein [Anatilimnocola floriformis]
MSDELQPRLLKVYDNHRVTETVKNLGRHQILFGSKQTELFVLEDGTSTLSFFNRSQRGGIVKRYQTYQDEQAEPKLAGAKAVAGLSAPLAMALSGNGNFLYVVSSKSGSIVCFKQNLRVGGWKPDSLSNGQFEELRETQALVVGGDGSEILVVTRSGVLLELRRDLDTGKISVLDRIRLSDHLPKQADLRDVKWDLTGDREAGHIYVVSSAGLLVVLKRDRNAKLAVAQVTRDRELRGSEPSHPEHGLSGATDLTIQPDGKLLFVVSARGSVGVWKRDRDSGELSFERILADDRLKGAMQVTCCSKSERLLVVSESGHSLAEICRKPSGELAVLQVLVSTPAVSLGFASPTAAAASSDDRFIYVASGENTLSVLMLVHDDELPGLH